MAPGLFQEKVPAFRDGFHFYFPQAVWLDQCAARGEFFPAWQSSEGLGTSVPGETTSALFYPLRVVWLLPLLTVAQRYALFVVMHLWIAAAGMSYACRRWQLRPESACMAGAAFALSCPIFFQQFNLVFLCSAAWLGFALAELGCLIHRADVNVSSPRVSVFALSLAMMLLAGDPHTAANVILLAAMSIVYVAIRSRSWSTVRQQVLWLSAATVLTVAVSAVQWLPSYLWAMHSHRWQGSETTASLQNKSLHRRRVSCLIRRCHRQ